MVLAHTYEDRFRERAFSFQVFIRLGLCIEKGLALQHEETGHHQFCYLRRKNQSELCTKIQIGYKVRKCSILVTKAMGC